MFDVFGFWGIVTLCTLPLPLMFLHMYLDRLYGLMKAQGVIPATSSLLHKNKFCLNESYFGTLVAAAVVQFCLVCGCGLYSLITGVSLVSGIADVATWLAPFGGFISALVVFCFVVYFGERLFLKVCCLMAKVEKLDAK